jgi:hypothetical protein
MAEWICLATFFGIIGLILNLAFRPLVTRRGLRLLLVLATLVVLHPIWLVFWILVGAHVGDATGWFRVEDSMRSLP